MRASDAGVVLDAQEDIGAGVDTGRQARAERIGVLLLRAQAGERECLREIVAELTPQLWNVVRGQGLSQYDAEDAVQSVWLSLVSCLAAIRSPNALIAWLVKAARREARRVRERGERTPPVDSEQFPERADPGASAEEQVLAEERRRMMRDALKQLPEPCVQLLRVLAASDRPDYEVVARALGMPRGAIGPTRGRCLNKLRTVIITDPRWSSLCP